MIIKLLLITVLLIETTISCDYRQHNKKFNSRRLSDRTSQITSKFEEHEIVPDVIDTVPRDKVQVSYPSGVHVNLGNELTPFSVKDQPSVKWPIEREQYYTLIMTDPDVPTRKEPTLGQVKHWLVINIPGLDLNKGETLAAYRGSAPPEGSGLHRYTFLVFKQSGYLKHSETHTIPIAPDNRKERVNFKVREFVKKYNLGEPIAGNFYQAQSDQYTRQLWAQWNQKTR